ncbi:DUF2314 domain-containing protein [Rhodanobacter sp. C05]|uniref:DUF2314 domain-containing protein n=1 Tax=Rhodanobacter sp. C05 TaxID=1945855 RepID=UPI000984099D|nr:DUF2314 domain-containing protein [Rhodanobacter sp. C05]
MKQPIFLLVALLAFVAHAQEPQLSPDAPKDKPVQIYTKDGEASLKAAEAPYIAKARSTYPVAKATFLAGLPQGEIFFATTILHDNNGAAEQVFIEVNSIQGDHIIGHIASQLSVVKGFQNGQFYTFPESALIDWLITHADGSEEGNYVGKFLDTYHGAGV